MSDHTPRVLYVVAKGRSGSNILAHALGQLPRYVNTGELYHLWRWGLRDGALCGCGEPVPRCPLWSAVVRRMGLTDADVAHVASLQDEVLSWRRMPAMLAGGPRPRSRVLREYAATRTALYEAIAAESGARVVVDASKWPWDPCVLGQVGLPVAALHLLRDPRAVVFSWQRRRSWGDHAHDPTPMPRFGAAYSSVSWDARCLTTELVRRLRSPVPWTTVHYEQFVAAPGPTLRRLATHIAVPEDPPMAGPRAMHMAPTHSIGGNASKFSTGVVQLRHDDEWQRSLAPRDRLVTTVLTAPLLAAYGLPVRTGPSERNQ